ncbi:MAG: arylesterase [Burkholderiales bacterium]
MCLGFAASAAPGSKVLVYGDSLSSAYGMPAQQGWVALLEERLKKEHADYSVANASISGETSAGGLARIGKTLEREKPAVLILELGGNDGLRGLPVPAMKKNLAGIIERAQKAGARVLLVGMRMPPNYGEAYNRAFEKAFDELAKEFRTAYLPFLLDGFGDKTELFQPDRIHPTETAQPIIVGNVWRTLAPLLRKK